MLSTFEWTIAKRYLLPGRGEAFIFLVAGISLIAVMLGVAALVIMAQVSSSGFTDAGGPADWFLIALVYGVGAVGTTVLTYAVLGWMRPSTERTRNA